MASSPSDSLAPVRYRANANVLGLSVGEQGDLVPVGEVAECELRGLLSRVGEDGTVAEPLSAPPSRRCCGG